MHLSLFHSRGYFSVFYRQLIKNSLGNLPSNLFSNLGNLTELYVEIYMYRSLFIVSLTQFISRCIYMYRSLFVFSLTQFIYIYTYIDINICSVIWAKGKRWENSLVGGGGYSRRSPSVPYVFSLHWQELWINAIPNRKRWQRVLEETFSM